MAEDSARGSDRLKHRYGAAELEQLLEVGDRVEARLVDFFPIGIPDPDGGWGVWNVHPDRIGSLLEALLQHTSVPGLKIFPRGIPSPDVLEVVFEAGSARRM
jgi:hypothetical protein